MKDEVLIEKLDDIQKEVSTINVNLVRNTKDLEHHIEISTEDIKEMKEDLSNLKKDVEPFKKHMMVMSALLKIILTIGGIAAAIIGVIELVVKLKG